MDELRESLREAARRQVPPVTSPARRRRRRAAGALVLAVVGMAAAAGAAELISVGEPVRDPKPAREGVRPAGESVIAVVADDPARRLPWGVRIYQTGGEMCALAGQVRAGALGIERDGVFRPAPALMGGACGRLDRIPFFGDVRVFEGPHPRTVVYGRARSGSEEGRVRHEGRVHRARPGRGGAFLFVFEGTAARGDFQLSASR